MAKTDLEKSHSKVSNFKLTLICLLLSISFLGIWLGVSLINKYTWLGYSILGGSGLVGFFSFLLISKFTR